MPQFRFFTPHRRGKWYPELTQAQRYAAAIGANFVDGRSGLFQAYRETPAGNALSDPTRSSNPTPAATRPLRRAA